MKIFKRKKKEKIKKKRNPYLISAKLTLAVVFLFIIGFTLFDMGKFFKSSSGDLTGAISLVKEEVDISTLTTSNAITEENKDEITLSLKEKIIDVNLDILTDNEIDKNKFKYTDVSISKDFTLSDQEFTILFNTLVKTLSEGAFVDNFLEVTISNNNDNFILYTVMKLNLDEFLNSIDGLKGLEIYLTNSYELEQTVNSFKIISSSCKVNNLSYEQSSSIVEKFSGESDNELNLGEVSFYFFNQLINNFTYNTSSSVSLGNHLITFSLNQ